MKNFFEINRAFTAKKKFFSFFALSAIVLGMASCGDGNEPEVNDFQFKIQALSTKARVYVTPSKKNTYFYSDYASAEYLDACGGVEAYSDKRCNEDDFDSFTSSEIILKDKDEYLMANLTPEKKYVVYAFYVEEGEDNHPVRVSKVYSQEFTTMPEHILNGEFTVNDAGKKVHFYSSNMGKYPVNGDNFFSNDQWWCLGKSQTAVLHDQLPWSEATDPNVPVLTVDEWLYLFRSRPNAEKLFAHATLTINDNEKKGIILLPDNWEKPDDSPLRTDFDLEILWDEQEKTYQKEGFDGFAANNLNEDQWTDLEFAGAVFLPAGGSDGSDRNKYGYYWTSTPNSETNAHMFSFGSSNISLKCLYTWSAKKTYYQSIRPVRYID